VTTIDVVTRINLVTFIAEFKATEQEKHVVSWKLALHNNAENR
jgi:hypothetical protein